MAVASQVGAAVTVSLGLTIGGGYLLDRWLGTRPLFLIAGVLVGLVGSWRIIMDLAGLDEEAGRRRR